MRIYSITDQTIVNRTTISEDIVISASGVTFVNTGNGRVFGSVTFEVGGSALINRDGGYIGVSAGSDEWTTPALIGSDWSDRVYNYGNISGLVDLGRGSDVLVNSGVASTFANSVYGATMGPGHDLLRFEGNAAPFYVYGDGGTGTDTFEFAASTRLVHGTHLQNFEILSLQAGGNYVDFDGYTRIDATTLDGDLYNLLNSDNPDAEVDLAGSYWVFQSSDIGTLLGSSLADRVTIAGSTIISNPVFLGRGDDSLAFEDGAYFHPGLPIDGGPGTRDQLSFQLDSSSILDLGNVSQFEILRLNERGSDAGMIVRLVNADGFEWINSAGQATLRLVSGDYSGTVISVLGGELGIAKGLTVESVNWQGSWVTGSYPMYDYADPTASTMVRNFGTITSDVVFFVGDDLYIERGSAAAVYGNGGNDRLYGGSSRDFFHGGHGADLLKGARGRDYLDGGAGADRIYGEWGADTLTGGADADRFYFDDGHLGSSASLTDIITDFASAEGDRMNLRKLDADITAAGDQNFVFLGKSTFTGHAGELRYEVSGDQTVVQMDIDGDGAADLFLILEGLHRLTSGDFIL